MLTSGRCIGECPTGQYFDYDTMSCKACGNNCLNCLNANSCSLCAADSSMTNSGDCYFDCPPGTYYEQTVDGTFCYNCHSSCEQCSGPEIDDCLSCKKDSLFSPDIIS